MAIPTPGQLKALRELEAAVGLVVCLDGPKRGQWFTAARWGTALAAASAQHWLNRQPATAILGYAPAGGTVGHPWDAEVRGGAMVYTSHRCAACDVAAPGVDAFPPRETATLPGGGASDGE